LVVVDSIQTMHTAEIESPAGSISQIRECAAQFMKFAKLHAVPVFLIGHINKEGHIAGPKILEHMVDVVLQFEGDRNHVYRILRSSKNRFGSTDEIGIYEMKGSGLQAVDNPSGLLMKHASENLSGTCVAATVEGVRPMLIEIQALVSTAAYGTPQRSATGFDLRRLNMLLAVLEKRCGFRLAAKDVFLNIVGGIKSNDPAIDLAVISAVLSSSEDLPVKSDYCFAAEVGLTGELRPVSKAEQRITEAQKMGFEKIYISSFGKRESDSGKYGIEVIAIDRVEVLFEQLFG
jgi:DNA repair protein RadA/Sms